MTNFNQIRPVAGFLTVGGKLLLLLLKTKSLQLARKYKKFIYKISTLLNNLFDLMHYSFFFITSFMDYRRLSLKIVGGIEQFFYK
jgi:hypothetical protein